MSRVICSVRGCHNNWTERREQLHQLCYKHNAKQSECCGTLDNLHPPPKEEGHLRQWLKALNLKRPPKRPYVCSYHFMDGKPTDEHPYPEKRLGYDAPVKKSVIFASKKSSSGGAAEFSRLRISSAQNCAFMCFFFFKPIFTFLLLFLYVYRLQ